VQQHLSILRIHGAHQFRQIAEAPDQSENQGGNQNEHDRHGCHNRCVAVAQGVENFDRKGFNGKAGHHVGYDILVQA